MSFCLDVKTSFLVVSNKINRVGELSAQCLHVLIVFDFDEIRGCVPGHMRVCRITWEENIKRMHATLPGNRQYERTWLTAHIHLRTHENKLKRWKWYAIECGKGKTLTANADIIRVYTMWSNFGIASLRPLFDVTYNLQRTLYKQAIPIPFGLDKQFK